ncbi:hypothetical protein GPALN_010842 [Globodera pallida]|nr:hypothetical protein GPALN_010842 [Globodera pallida]
MQNVRRILCRCPPALAVAFAWALFCLLQLFPSVSGQQKKDDAEMELIYFNTLSFILSIVLIGLIAASVYLLMDLCAEPKEDEEENETLDSICILSLNAKVVRSFELRPIRQRSDGDVSEKQRNEPNKMAAVECCDNNTETAASRDPTDGKPKPNNKCFHNTFNRCQLESVGMSKSDESAEGNNAKEDDIEKGAKDEKRAKEDDIEKWAMEDIEKEAKEEDIERVAKEDDEKGAKDENGAKEEDIEKWAKEDNIEKVAKEEDIEKVAKEDNIEKVAKEDNIGKGAKEDNIEKVAKEEDIEKVAKEDNIEKVAKEDNIGKGAKEDNIEKVAKEDNIGKGAKEDDNGDADQQNKKKAEERNEASGLQREDSEMGSWSDSGEKGSSSDSGQEGSWSNSGEEGSWSDSGEEGSSSDSEEDDDVDKKANKKEKQQQQAGDEAKADEQNMAKGAKNKEKAQKEH